MQLIPFTQLIRRYQSGEAFVLFDTETTGLNTYHDEIVEIAGMVWQKGATPQTFCELIRVNPNKMTAGAWEVHKIPMDDIARARPASEVLRDFMAFTGHRALLAHNIKFDYEMLNSNLIRAGLLPIQNNDAFCSYQYCKERTMPGKLMDLAAHYQVDLKKTQLHRALYDVWVLSEVMNSIMKEHEPKELQYSLIL